MTWTLNFDWLLCFNPATSAVIVFLYVQMCFEWFTKGQHDLESDVQQQLFKEKILKLEPYEITMNGEGLNTDPFSTDAVLKKTKKNNLFYVSSSGFGLFKTFFENVNLCDHRLKRQGTQLVGPHSVFLLCKASLCYELTLIVSFVLKKKVRGASRLSRDGFYLAHRHGNAWRRDSQWSNPTDNHL